ncbi:hypothetical protein EK904_005716, partial [Melospiza melodia maxima]
PQVANLVCLLVTSSPANTKEAVGVCEWKKGEMAVLEKQYGKKKRQAEFPGKTVVSGSSWKELHSHKMGLVEGIFSTVQL